MDEFGLLQRLAPHVDPDLAAAEFRRRVSRVRIMRGGATVVSSIVLILVVLLALDMRTGSSDRSSVMSGEQGPSTPVDFTVLAVADAVSPMGTLRLATNRDELRGLWKQSGSPLTPPDVDFTSVVVVSMTIPDDGCPPALTELKLDGSTITPHFIESSSACPDLLKPQTFVVALDLAGLPPNSTLHLPGQELYRFGDKYLDLFRNSVEPGAAD